MARQSRGGRGRRGPDPQFKDVINPGRGLNKAVVDIQVDDKESPDLNNIQFVDGGNPSKRYGFEIVGVDPGGSNGIVGLGSYYTTSVREVHRRRGSLAEKWDGSAWSIVTIASGVSITSNQLTNFVQGHGKLVAHNAVNHMQVYTGTTWAAPPTGIIGKAGIYYSGRNHVFGNSTNTSRLYVSVPGTIDDFTGAGNKTIDISKDDGQKITGVAKFNEVLVIFKEGSTWQLTYDSTGTEVVKQVSASVGCVSHRSIESVENDVFFLSRRGVYVLGNEPNFFDVIRTNELSVRVNSILDTISTTNFERSSAIYDDFRYRLSIPEGGTSVNNKVVTYDRQYLAWSQETGYGANCFTAYVDSTNDSQLMFGNESDGAVYKFNENYSDDGVAISAYWASKNHDLGDNSRIKQFLWVTVTFKQVSGNVRIFVIIDGEEIDVTRNISSTATTSSGFGSRQFGASQFGAGTGASSGVLVSSNTPYRIPINRQGRTIQIKIENNNLNQTFTLLQYQIAYRPYGPRTFPSTNILYN